jgi:GT2 family glycosyltransferase
VRKGSRQRLACETKFDESLMNERRQSMTHEASPREPLVTVVVVPRERFSCTQRCLESVLADTCYPHKLVYVDGGSPRSVHRYLRQRAEAQGFQLVRTRTYLSPNRARNLGLAHADTKYTVFLDNDVVVSPGWLEALVNCAEETGAAVVGPLTCQYEPVHEIVHCAGGECGASEKVRGETVSRSIVDRIYHQGKQVAEIRDQLARCETGVAEFHCLLARTEILETIGGLDEGLFNTKEHIDFCMSVRQAGGTIYFEPSSLVTYLGADGLTWSDLPFYMLRWSDAWELKSLKRLREKWDLDEDQYFKQRCRQRGWRRRVTIIKPFCTRISFGRRNRPLEKVLGAGDRVLNYFVTARHAMTERPNGVIE